MLPVFVINLDRRPDRWDAVVSTLGQLDVVPIRIPAVDAQAVSDKELGLRVAIDKPYQWLRRGSEANILSHCKAWEALLASGHPACLIAEDDAEFAADLPSVLQSADGCESRMAMMPLG